MFQIEEEKQTQRAKITVVGVGGGGGNALKTMYQSGFSGVDFLVANTDMQALEEFSTEVSTIQLGAQLTKGLGAGSNPEVGRRAAIESSDEIAEALKDQDMVFITAGMGGGTGTGSAGVIASIAKQSGALTVAVVTRPFFFEGGRRARYAELGIQFLKDHVDVLIVVPNQKLLKTADSGTSLLSAFKKADNILLKAVKGIADLVNKKGLINLDFADVKTIMSDKGLAIIGTGMGGGEDRALVASQMAITSPLLEESSFKGATGLIINITGGPDLSIVEVNQMAEHITGQAHPEAEIIFGAIVDPGDKTGKVSITVIATGFDGTIHSNKNNTENLLSKKESIQDSAAGPATERREDFPSLGKEASKEDPGFVPVAAPAAETKPYSSHQPADESAEGAFEKVLSSEEMETGGEDEINSAGEARFLDKSSVSETTLPQDILHDPNHQPGKSYGRVEDSSVKKEKEVHEQLSMIPEEEHVLKNDLPEAKTYPASPLGSLNIVPEKMQEKREGKTFLSSLFKRMQKKI